MTNYYMLLHRLRSLPIGSVQSLRPNSPDSLASTSFPSTLKTPYLVQRAYYLLFRRQTPAKCSARRKLMVWFKRPTFAAFRSRGTLLNLRELIVQTNTTIRLGALKHIGQMRHLTTLALSDGHLSPKITNIVRKLTELRVLSLNYGRRLHGHNKTHAGDEIRKLTTLTSLLGLSVPYLSQDNAHFILERLTKLQNLHAGRINLAPGDIPKILAKDKRWANFLTYPAHVGIQVHILGTTMVLNSPELLNILLAVRKAKKKIQI